MLGTIAIAIFGGNLFGCEMPPVVSILIMIAIGIAIIPIDLARKAITKAITK